MVNANREQAQTYTMADLVEVVRQLDPESAAKGDQPIIRRINDWIEKGLLDNPDRRGGGYRAGVMGVWSGNQRELLAVLVRKRKEVDHIAALCNIPVGLWLYWGEEHVPLRQVRKALHTWAHRAYFSEPSTKEAARLLLKEIDHPSASPADRRRFVREVARSLYRCEFDDKRLLPLMWNIYDPSGAGITRTKGGVPVTPELLLEHMKVRSWVTTKLDEIPDEYFHWARHSNLMMRASYRHHTVALHGEEFFKKSDTAFDPQHMYGDACQDLMALLWQATIVPTKMDGDPENPKTWRREQLTSEIKTREGKGGYRIEGTISKSNST